MSFSSHQEMSFEDTFIFIKNLCPPDVKGALGENMRDTICSICTNRDINMSNTAFLASIFDAFVYQSTDEGKIMLFKLEVILKAAIIHYRSNLPEHVLDQINTVHDLLIDYPTFVADNIDAEEREKLLIFRNMMNVALNFIPPKNNKRLLLSICGTLEGTAKFYSSGGAPSRSTGRRKLIFEQESQLEPAIRRSTKRKMHSTDSTDSDNKKLVTCECGSAILPRTRWRHCQSIRHCNYLAGLSKSRSLPSTMSQI